MLDGFALDRFTLYKGDNITCKKVVSGLWWLGDHNRVGLAHVMAKLQVVILPGEVSMLLLI